MLGCRSCTFPSIHFLTALTLKITVRCPSCSDPNIIVNKTCTHVVDRMVRSTKKWGAVGTSTRAVARPIKPPHQQRYAPEFASSALLALLRQHRRRLLTRKGILRLGESALHAVHLGLEIHGVVDGDEFLAFALLALLPQTTPGHLKRSPLRSRGRPAAGSTQSSPAAWESPHSPSLRRVAHGRSFDPLRFHGVGEISGHVILQLQNTNDLAALRCMTAETAKLARSEPQHSWIGACGNHHYNTLGRTRNVEGGEDIE